MRECAICGMETEEGKFNYVYDICKGCQNLIDKKPDDPMYYWAQEMLKKYREKRVREAQGRSKGNDN